MRAHLFFEVTASFSSVPDVEAFEQWKKIVVQQFLLHSADGQPPPTGLFCLAILDDFLLLDSNVPVRVTADELAGFMKIYPEFLDCCIHLAEGDGLFGEVKYGVRVTHAVDVIQSAIELAV